MLWDSEEIIGQDKKKSQKQNEIAETFVFNYFDMSSQVPGIYQVPDLALSLQPDMSGATPNWSFVVRTWSELPLQV